MRSAVMCRKSFPGSPALESCPGSLVVPFHLSFLTVLVSAVLSWLWLSCPSRSCHASPVLAVLFCLTGLFGLFCLSCSGCPVLAVQFRLSLSGCPVLDVSFWLFCASCYFLTILYWLSSPFCPPWLSYPNSLVLAALSWPSCLGSLVMVILFPCPSLPVLF